MFPNRKIDFSKAAEFQVSYETPHLPAFSAVHTIYVCVRDFKSQYADKMPVVTFKFLKNNKEYIVTRTYSKNSDKDETKNTKGSAKIVLTLPDNTKITAKKLLPKLKQYRRKNSCDNSRPFHLNVLNNNNNNDNQIINKSLNLSKIMIIIKDKTPEKKNHLRSINNRLPSASSSKIRESFSINTNHSTNIKPKHLLLIQNKLNTNILIEDTNDTSFKMINLNGLNKSSLLSNIIGYSGKDFFREIIKNEIKKNNTVSADMTSAFQILDKIPEKNRGTGAVICMCSMPSFLRENVLQIPYWFI